MEIDRGYHYKLKDGKPATSVNIDRDSLILFFSYIT